MGQKISVYLSDEAIKNLDEVQAYLTSLCGVTISRSATLSVLLVRGTPLYLNDQGAVRGVVAKSVPQSPEAEPMAQELEQEQGFMELEAEKEMGRKPMNIEEYERFGSMEGWAEKLGVGDE